MFEFQLLTIAIGIVGLWAFGWAVFRVKDVFHPLAVLMPMVLYLYVYMPIELISGKEIVLNFFTDEQWALVQAINLFCVVALVAGTVAGGKWKIHLHLPLTFPPKSVEKVYRFGLTLGCLSLLAYAININNVGGLFEAYSREKGGGTAESGYLRDAIFWVVPAIASMGFCAYHTGLRPRFWIASIVFALPLLFQGLLGARRGPTFVIISAMAVTWYVARRKRPSLVLFIGGGALLGFLLLLIVTFRNQFRLGSDLFSNAPDTLSTMLSEYDEARGSSVERTLGGNEFVYGTNVVLSFLEKTEVYWGTRLLTIMFIRPIPKQIWATKYEDVGMERYLVNVGLGSDDDLLMETTHGAAPGFVADMFAEFSWAAVLVAYLTGWTFGRTWRSAVSRAGLGLVMYVLLFAFSIFFVLQTMEAIVFRLMFAGVPVLIFWGLSMRGAAISHPAPAPVSETRLTPRALTHAAPARLPTRRPAS